MVLDGDATILPVVSQVKAVPWPSLRVLVDAL